MAEQQGVTRVVGGPGNNRRGHVGSIMAAIEHAAGPTVDGTSIPSTTNRTGIAEDIDNMVYFYDEENEMKG